MLGDIDLGGDCLGRDCLWGYLRGDTDLQLLKACGSGRYEFGSTGEIKNV